MNLIKKIIVTPILFAGLGFMPMQVQQTPPPVAVAESLPTAVIREVPAPSQSMACVPAAGGQRRVWLCDNRHSLTFSEPMAYCREIGRQYVCERE